MVVLQGSLVRDMDSSQLLSVIHSVPETVNSDLLGQFVRHCVLPFVLQRLPQSLVNIDFFTIL